MRWLAFVLLLANVGVWFYFSTLAPYRTVAPPRDVAGRLPRVSELEVVVPGSPTPQSQTAAEPPMESLPGQEGVSEADAAGVQSLPEDVVVEPLPLIEAQKAEAFCVRLGWFDTASAAQQAISKLPRDVRGEDVQVREVNRDLGAFHWVIIPPQANEDEAFALFQEIQRKGIDSYLVTEGPQKNAISLGLFESRGAAERVLAQRNAQNLNAVLALFPRNHISYALVFEATYVPGSQELVADQAEFSRRFESVEISGCEGVATAEKTP